MLLRLGFLSIVVLIIILCKHWIKSSVGYFFGAIPDLLFRPVDFICIDLANETKQVKDRIVMKPLGPASRGCPYIAMINGPDSATLQRVISGDDPELRKPLEVFNTMFDTGNSITSVSFLTDVMHGNEKREPLKLLISGDEVLGRLYQVSTKLIHSHFNSWTNNSSVNDKISALIFDFFGRIAGFDHIPHDAIEMFEEMENRIIYDAPPKWGFLPLTMCQWRYLMTMRKYQKQFIPRLFKLEL